MPARLVLDQHLKLQAKMAGPDEVLVQHIQLFSLDAYREGREAELMFYPYRPYEGLEGVRDAPTERQVAGAAGRAEARHWCTAIGRDLLTARTYQVTGEMVDAVNGVYEKTMRKVDHLEEHELPSPAGFVWLDKPLSHLDRHNAPLTIRAFTWALTSVRHRSRVTGASELSPAIRIGVWSWLSDETAPEFNSGEDKMSASMEDYLSKLGELSLTHVYVMPFGERFPAMASAEVADNTAAWLHILWMFLDAEVAVTRRPPLDRHAVKRARRQRLAQGEVNVVVLRRARHLGTEVEPGHREVDWSCRWLVQGHHRHLDAYEGPRHHGLPSRDAGPLRCLTCGARLAWVHAYLKGPDDKPLKATEQVWRLSR